MNITTTVDRAKTESSKSQRIEYPQNERIFEYPISKPHSTTTVVDRCPTAVDKDFVSQKALSTAFIPSKILPHVRSRLLERKTLQTTTRI